MNFVHEIICGELFTNQRLSLCFLTSLETWQVYEGLGKTYMKSEKSKRFDYFLILEVSLLTFQFCNSWTQI